MFSHAMSASMIFHLVFNMIWLVFLGSILEREIGSRAFLVLYVLAGMLGGLLHVIISPIPVVGASGAVSGLILAIVALHPMITLQSFVLPPMPIWLLGTIYIVVSLLLFLMDLAGAQSLVAHDLHFFGGVIGFSFMILCFQPRWVSDLRWLQRLHGAPHEPDELFTADFDIPPDTEPALVHKPTATAATQQAEPPQDAPPSEAEVDRVLDRLSTVGLSGLSADERDVLEKAAEARNKGVAPNRP